MKRLRPLTVEDYILPHNRLCKYFGVSTSLMPAKAASEILRQSESAANYVREERDALFARLQKAEAEARELRETLAQISRLSCVDGPEPAAPLPSPAPLAPSSSPPHTTRAGKPAARRKD